MAAGDLIQDPWKASRVLLTMSHLSSPTSLMVSKDQLYSIGNSDVTRFYLLASSKLTIRKDGTVVS